MRWIALFLLARAAVPGATPETCPAGAPVGRFHLLVRPDDHSPARPISQVNRLLPGYKLLYRPGSDLEDKKAELALVIVPADRSEMKVLDSAPASQPAEWSLPVRCSIVALVWGPKGLNEGKVKNLVTKDRELIAQLAEYAQKTAEAESLLQALAQPTAPAGQNLDVAVMSFASQYGTANKLDRSAPTEQQTLTMLRAVNPALSTYDPLNPEPSKRVQQTAGLAAAVAGLFFGNTVGIAAGSAAMLTNLRTMVFPRTEFRSAFAHAGPDEAVSLCARREPSQARTKLAYLWATRVPDAAAPALTIEKPVHLPIGIRSSVPVKASDADWRLASRVQGWSFAEKQNGKAWPAKLSLNRDTRSLELDLSQAAPPPGEYTLRGKWDWDPMTVAGNLELHPFSSMEHVHLTGPSSDALIAGRGKVPIVIEGADFQFVDKLLLKNPADRYASPTPLNFALPLGLRCGPQEKMEAEIDTRALTPGKYMLEVAQQNGKVSETPVRVLPEPPAISNTPLRANTGEPEQRIVLRGAGLDRLEKISCEPATCKLGEAKGAKEREMAITLPPGATPGTRIPLQLTVESMQAPVTVENAIDVVGPRPVIESARASLPGGLPVALKPGELPAGTFATFELRVRDAGAVPSVLLGCRHSEPSTTVRASDQRPEAKLRISAPGSLFLLFEPGAVGRSGCELTVAVDSENGRSDPKIIGTVIRLPGIESFELSDEKLGDGLYAGVLKGKDLEIIDKTGWDEQNGTAVQQLPAAVPGEGQRQTLKVPMPWPAPAPHAPLYVWLRGEQQGRATTLRY
jgi:hypothetical protein